MYVDSDKSVQCWKRMHFNHSCFCCNEKTFTEEKIQGGIIQILIHTYVNIPVHVHVHMLLFIMFEICLKSQQTSKFV